MNIIKIICLVLAIAYTPQIIKGTFKKEFTCETGPLIIWAIGIAGFCVIQFHLY